MWKLRCSVGDKAFDFWVGVIADWFDSKHVPAFAGALSNQAFRPPDLFLFGDSGE